MYCNIIAHYIFLKFFSLLSLSQTHSENRMKLILVSSAPPLFAAWLTDAAEKEKNETEAPDGSH